MSYTRNAVLAGEVVNLRVVFTDDAGKLVDTDAIPSVYIYDQTVARDTVDAELSALTFTSVLAGPLTPTRITEGFYELQYTVPAGQNEGTWHDVWVANVNTVAANKVFSFNVEQGANVSTQNIGLNTLITVELDSSIANTDSSKTLGEDVLLSYTTTLSPFYASPELVRTEAGTFLDYIPDDTLALMIHWASKEADFVTPPKVMSQRLGYARAKFVVFDTVLRSFNMPGGRSGFTASQGISAEGTKKSLGDLMIDRSSSARSLVPSTSSGVDVETVAYFREQRQQWYQVLNGGAFTNPGQGFAPNSATRGLYDTNRRVAGRLWENPENVVYPVAGANVKRIRPGSRKGRFGYAHYRRSKTRYDPNDY